MSSLWESQPTTRNAGSGSFRSGEDDGARAAARARAVCTAPRSVVWSMRATTRERGSRATSRCTSCRTPALRGLKSRRSMRTASTPATNPSKSELPGVLLAEEFIDPVAPVPVGSEVELAQSALDQRLVGHEVPGQSATNEVQELVGLEGLTRQIRPGDQLDAPDPTPLSGRSRSSRELRSRAPKVRRSRSRTGRPTWRRRSTAMTRRRLTSSR